MKKKILLEAAVIAYVILFAYTAASKLLDVQLFNRQLNRQPFDHTITPFLSFAIPIVELLIVLALVIPRLRIIGLKAATGLMLVFTGYIGLVKIKFFADVPCSCGGAIAHLSWSQHLFFNLFFLLLGLAALVVYYRQGVFKFH